MTDITGTPDELRPADTAFRFGIGSIIVTAFFGLLYAWDVWEAVENLLSLPAVYSSIGLDASFVPWWLLIAGIAIPPLLFFAAFWLGLRRRLIHRAALLLVGLGVSAAATLSSIALASSLLAASLPDIPGH